MYYLDVYLITGLLLFIIGIFIVLIRRNIVRIFMGIILMVNGACLNFVVFSRFVEGGSRGQIAALFIITVMIAELVTALAILVNHYRHLQDIDVEKANTLKG